VTLPLLHASDEADPRPKKQERIKQGGRPRVLDLFSGCGGFSLGFHRAGFDIAPGVDIDAEAATSHKLNFHHDDADPVAKDIVSLEPEKVTQELGYDRADKAVDVLIGGPPCQSYARVGRAKLREIADHPEAYRIDPRGNLYLRYLHYVEALKPLVIVMENVPDVLNYGGHNIAEETAEALEDLGYECSYTLMNAVFYGVPQMRERMFLIACHHSLAKAPSFPAPTHHFDLPRGYLSSRSVATKLLSGDLLTERPFRFKEPPSSDPRNCQKAVSVGEALRDLPPVREHLEGKMKRGARDLSVRVPYSSVRPSRFAQEMRNWPGFESKKGVTGHVIRHLPRDYRIFRQMQAGDQYPEAHAIAERLFEEHIGRLRAKGEQISDTSQRYFDEKARFVPPYDPGKFPNKWRKLAEGEPSRTLMAHLGKDSYSHIHHDHDQARTISVREAARLQSFPDGFIFSGAMNAALRQIGNAVPPLMAYRIAEHVALKVLEFDI
jgi:DNA (cytosine-5)-methyltransferase 1